jgi:hypothetical protein
MELLDHPNLEDSTTKPSRVYRMYSTGRSIVAWTFLFWLTYTIIYQFVDGWHWDPVSKSEAALDLITRFFWNIGAILMIVAWTSKLDDIMEKTK